jgi:hypothetical protein
VTPLERKLAEFVDRTPQMERFCEILKSRSKPIIFVSGDSGSGKSSLLARMIHECSAQNIARARIEWNETRNPDYLAIMRGLRDDLGVEHFSSFTALVNAYYDERVKLDLTVNSTGNITVGAGAVFKDATVGQMSGVVVRDCMIVVPRRDLGVSENERMVRLTEQFLTDLAILTAATPVVTFFDSVEKMTDEARKWMWGEFMAAVRDERVRNIICVHCGCTKPDLDRDTRLVMEETVLGPLGLSDIEEYLLKRKVICSAPREIATLILTVTNGHPIGVANVVDSYEREQEKLAQKAGG